MRILRSHLPPLAFCVLAWPVAPAKAQEPPPAPTPAPTPAPAEQKPAPTPSEGAPAPEAEVQPRRPRRQPIVIEGGTVHPVAGGPIENGVVVIRGERIVAVGKKGEVQVPDNAIVHAFPTGHVYPGLIDAATDAFTDAALRGDGTLDGGIFVADGLRVRGDRDDELVQNGITTAYVTVRSPAQMRGQGAIVRPLKNGFELWKGKEQAGVELRMTNGPAPTHALQRQQQLDALVATFDGLEEYKKARTDHEEAVKKYDKEFADYLAFHQKKKDGQSAPANPAPAATQPAGPPAGENPQRGQRGPGGGRRGGQGGGTTATPEPLVEELIQWFLDERFAPAEVEQDPRPAPAPGPTPAPAPATQERQGPPAPGSEAPKRPTFPRAPARDPQKDALQRVLDGELPLRVEAHRPDELRGALRLQQKNTIPLLVLEHAYGASAIAGDIAAQGACVVLTEVLPNSMPELYKEFDPTALPKKLQDAGVPFAIATGSARRAALLGMMAAAAVGKGLDREQALRAVTLTPAEILGVAKDTGSLQAGKFADVMVCDRPLFASDSRVLFVLGKGRTEYEAR